MPYVRFHAVQGDDPNGTPIAGVIVSGHSDTLGDWTADPTNACGDTFALLAPGQYDITFRKPGYADAGYYPASIGTEGGPITKGMQRASSGGGAGNPHPAPVTAELTVSGAYFALWPNYERFTAIECSDFNLLNRWQHGPDTIRPVLEQRAAAGFNLLRVWTAYDIPGIGTFLDIWYDLIPEFVDLCASYGLYVEFTAYTGINDPQHWPKLCDAARACTIRPLLELVNELSENTNEPDFAGRVFMLSDYTKPAGLLTSHGSNGSGQRPVEPFWDYTTFHTNGAAAEEWKVGNPTIWTGPSLTNETSRFPDGGGLWARPDALQLAFDAAARGVLACAGSCFHSALGKLSLEWDADTLRAAQTWARSAGGIDLTTRGRQIPNGETQALFMATVAGYPFGQQTVLDVMPQLEEYGIVLTPPNEGNDQTKIWDPVTRRWVRVGFGEGHWVWILQ